MCCTAMLVRIMVNQETEENLRNEDWAGNGDESAVDLRASVGRLNDRARSQQSNLGASSDVAVRGRRGEHGECLDW